MNTYLSKKESQKSRNRDLFFSPTTIQPKLTIGQPNDKYEQQADAMADKVMQMPQSSTAPAVQTKCTECEQEDQLQAKPLIQKMEGEEEEALQTKLKIQKMEGEEEEALQTKPLMLKGEGGGGVATQALSSQLNGTKGSGSNLPKSTNNFMSQAFGSDFSNVKVHTGSNAIQMNQGLNARAFTHGSDIYFNKGQYSPESSNGKKLLAHELTHVVQQGGKKTKNLQRAVNAMAVSCRNPSQALRRIVGNNPVNTIQAADRRAIELLNDAIGALTFAQNQVRGGQLPAWPTFSDTLALALRNRFGVNPESQQFWTTNRHITSRRGSATLLLKRLRSVRSLLDSNYLRYTCIAPTCDTGDWAFTFAGDRRIRLCRPFWESNSIDNQALTLIHEVFHVYFDGTDTGLSMWNAHCIEQFIADINTIPIQPEFDGSCS